MKGDFYKTKLTHILIIILLASLLGGFTVHLWQQHHILKALTTQ